MNIKPATLAFALFATPFSAAFACDVPVAPPTPDGGSATMEDMVASQGEVKAFQAANADYLTCVDDQMTSEKAAMDEGDNDADERYALAAADYNAAVSREEKVAAEFNAAIRAFKAGKP